MFEVVSFVFNCLMIGVGIVFGLIILYCIVCLIVFGAKELKKEVADDESTE